MINVIIPPQNFEIVRDRIATILSNECTNQGNILNAAVPNSGNYLKSAVVTVERSNPVDKVDVPTINVSVINDDFSNKHQGRRDGLVGYAIDLYASAKTTTSNKGDKIATLRLQKLLGFCSYVLEDPIYKTLDFAAGLIGRTYCQGFQIRPIGPEDADNQAMARLMFFVLMKEENALLTAPLVTDSKTTMIIENTSQGYFIDNVIIP